LRPRRRRGTAPARPRAAARRAPAPALLPNANESDFGHCIERYT
jgi:hypothetical protein